MTSTAGLTPSFTEKLAGGGGGSPTSLVTEHNKAPTTSAHPPPPPKKEMSASSSSASNRRYNRKVAVMGYPCVGKSSITLRFVNGSFPDAYDTTIEDLHSKVYTFKGRDYQLRITDTAGQQEYSIFPRSCSVDVDGFILVYAIDDRKSFEIIQIIHDKIIESVGDRNIPLCVVGNKLDLQYASRQVTTEEGQQLANIWGSAFIETSAKENNKAAVHGIFDKIILQIEVAKGNMNPNGTPRSPGRQNKSCAIS